MVSAGHVVHLPSIEAMLAKKMVLAGHACVHQPRQAVLAGGGSQLGRCASTTRGCPCRGDEPEPVKRLKREMGVAIAEEDYAAAGVGQGDYAASLPNQAGP